MRASERDWFNAILVCGADAFALRSVDHRERGYKRVRVHSSRVEPYAPEDGAWAEGDMGLYAGREGKRNDALLPNRAYLQLCIEAAARWGGEFLSDFLSTTHVARVTLREFLESQ